MGEAGVRTSTYNKVQREAQVIPRYFVIFDLICGLLQKRQNILKPDKCALRETKISIGQRTKSLPKGYVALRRNIFHIQLISNNRMRCNKRQRKVRFR